MHFHLVFSFVHLNLSESFKFKLKRLREIIFEDSSSSEEEEANNDLEMAIGTIFNEDFWPPRRGSQVNCMHTNEIDWRANQT